MKTTAEQQEEKRKEREKKAISFTKGMSQIFKNVSIVFWLVLVSL